MWSSLAAPMQVAAAFALDESPVVTDHLAASRRLHAAVVRAVHGVFVGAGARCRPPDAAFYLYPDLEPMRAALAERGIHTGSSLADHLLDEHGVAVLAGEHFGDDVKALRFRVATSLLYGPTTEQRWAALRSADPVSLPWISDNLDQLAAALAALSR